MSNPVVELGRQKSAGGDQPGKLFDADELAEFLRDPIAYGQFDWTDPITLDEFVTAPAFKGLFVAPLVT